MAFSFGAAAGGAADALTQMLVERRTAALDAQRAEEARLDREYRDRQLAQQLQIAKMQDELDRKQAEASAAGRQLANIGKTYMETGKAALGGTSLGQEVPDAMQRTLLGTQSVLNEFGEPAVLPAGLSIEPTLPFTTNMPSPTAEMPMAMPTPLTSLETVATLPEMPPSEGVRPIAGLQRIQGPIGQQVRRVPTAAEAEQERSLTAMNAFLNRVDPQAALAVRERQINQAFADIGSLPASAQTSTRLALNELQQGVNTEYARSKAPLPIVIQTPYGPAVVDRKTKTAAGITMGGQTIGPTLPAGARDAQVQALQLQSVIDSATKNYNEEWVGPIKGRYKTMQLALVGEQGDQGLADLAFDLAQIENTLVYLRTGKQMNENEAERIRREVPSMNLPPDVFVRRLSKVRDYFNRWQQNVAKVYNQQNPGRAESDTDAVVDFMKRRKAGRESSNGR